MSKRHPKEFFWDAFINNKLNKYMMAIRNCLKYWLLILPLSSCNAQNKPTRIPLCQFTKMGYNEYTLRVFAITQTPADGRHVSHDTIGQFCSNNKMNTVDSQYTEQWQFLKQSSGRYRVDKARFNNSTQGSTVTDTMLFMHPPRFDYLTILQFCPYPYFPQLKTINSKWEWDFVIGKSWTTDSIFNFNGGPETFKIRYKFSDTTTLTTSIGSLFCYKVDAISTSRFGTSSNTFYLNNDYGLVRFTAKTTTSIVFTFQLIAKGIGDELMSTSDGYLKGWQNIGHPQNKIYGIDTFR